MADTQQPLGLPGTIVDAAAADYDGDGRTDLIVFDGIRKSVWLGNTRLPDGQPLDVWFAYAEDECEQRDAVRAVQDLVFSSHGWVAEGSYEWRSEHDFAAGCDPEDDDCVPPIVTARSLAEFFAWIDGLDPAPGGDDLAAPRAVTHAGYELPCVATDVACWDRPLLRTEVAYYFGRFLTDRRSVDLAPHRWVLPTPAPRADGPAPPS